MNNPKQYPDFASAEPALLRGEAVAIPIGASLTEGTFATLEQWTGRQSNWRARILEQGKAPYYFTPAAHEWITTKGDLVRIINKAYPGVTYVSLETFNAKAQEVTA